MSALAHFRRFRLRASAPGLGTERGGVHLALLALALLTGSSMHVKSAALTPYPLSVCIVTGDKLEKDAVVFAYDGREIKTCCTNCIDDFYKDPAGYVAKMEEAAERASNK